MPVPKPSFSIGVEEEYLLVDLDSRDLVSEPPRSLMDDFEARLGGNFSREFLKPQVEVGTRVCQSVSAVRDELARLRRSVAAVANGYGMAIIAASTHPFAAWRKQKHTAKARYEILQRDMQVVANRLLIGGMHVHVGIEDNGLRIDTLNQITYFLPHLLALSTSSPFWEGSDTGLKSYRLCVFDALPRTGLPEHFASYGEFRRAVDVMIGAGLLEDDTKLWWDVRPSARFPTLETRITDVCPRLDDAICIAALVRCLCRMLYRLRLANQRWRVYARMLVHENRWRAQRYGIDEGMVDFGRGEIVPFADLMEELFIILREDAEAFDCEAEIQHARTIIERGTGAHAQLGTYRQAIREGATKQEALKRVVDDLIEATISGV